MDETTEKRPCCTETRDAFWTLMSELRFQAKELKRTAGFIKNCSYDLERLGRNPRWSRVREEFEWDCETVIKQAENVMTEFKSTINSAKALLRGEEIVLHLTHNVPLGVDERTQSSNSSK